jgi:hypothetical protein
MLKTRPLSSFSQSGPSGLSAQEPVWLAVVLAVGRS